MPILVLEGRNVFKMLTRVHLNRFKDIPQTPNTVIILICFQKYSETFYKKVNVRSKALCDTQHRNLVFKIVSKYTDKLCDWLSIGYEETAFSLYIYIHPHTDAQTKRTQPTNLEILNNCTDVGRADEPPSHCA